jgi:hypothetical protein
MLLKKAILNACFLRQLGIRYNEIGFLVSLLTVYSSIVCRYPSFKGPCSECFFFKLIS